MELFRNPSAWSHAASMVRAFGIPIQFATDGSNRNLRQLWGFLNERRIALEVGILPLHSGVGGCGFEVEGFSSVEQSINVAMRLRKLGITPTYFDFDEPIYFGHFFDGRPGKIACHYTAEQVAAQVSARTRDIAGIFPTARFGVTEPIYGKIDNDQWLKTEADFLSGFRRRTGHSLSFFQVEIVWKSRWLPLLKRLATMLRRHSIPLEVIVNGGSGDTSSGNWMEDACRNFKRILTSGVTPSVYVIESWNKFPISLLPESDKSALTNLIDEVANRIHNP